MRSPRSLILSIFLMSSVNLAAKNDPQVSSAPAFEENKGQVVDQFSNHRNDILFYGNANGLGYYLRSDGMSYQLYKTSVDKENAADKSREIPNEQTTTIYRIDISWPGANARPVMAPENEHPDNTSYYLAHCPDGITDVKSYSGVVYQNLYPGIDLKYYHKEGQLKYDYIVNPGADPKNIQLKISGAEQILKNTDGTINIKTPLGDIVEAAPVVLQEGREIGANWMLNGDVLTFSIAGYDKSKPLIIDPLARQWGTCYNEGATHTNGLYCKADNKGNVYISGHTGNIFNIATSGTHQSSISNGGSDVYVVKFNSMGGRVWGTYFGGESLDEPYAIALDTSNNIYVTGLTLSLTGIATSGAVQDTLTLDTNKQHSASYDAFLVKFNSNGIRLWGTYYGGIKYEVGLGCTTDRFNNVYICGTTSSYNLPPLNAHQPSYGGFVNDGFLVKFSSTGTKLWSTYYGGSDQDEATACAADNLGNLYLIGKTRSTNNISFGTVHQPNLSGGNFDNFIVQFNSAGVRQWGTYYGGTSDEVAAACVVDNLNNLYICGQTFSSTGISSAGAVQTTLTGGAGESSFMAKFNSTGARRWGTYYSGNGTYPEYATSCALDNYGHLYMAGCTGATSGFATSNAYQTTRLGVSSDGYVVSFDTAGGVESATYYGGTNEDIVYGCTADNNNNVYISGYTFSTNGIITPGAFQGYSTQSNQGIHFLVKLTSCYTAPVVISTSASGRMKFCAGDSVTLQTPKQAGFHYQWLLNGDYIAGATDTAYKIRNTGSYAVIASSGQCVSIPSSMNVVSETVNTSVSKTNILCNSTATGSITVTPSSGTVPYHFAWTSLTDTTATISGLTAATYMVTTSDSVGCYKNDTVTITQLPAITAANAATAVKCFGGQDGAAGVTVAGGTAPYRYLWNNAATTANITGLSAGRYTLVIKDTNNCIKNDSIDVTEPTVLQANFTRINNSCFGDSAGALAVSVSGGVTPYSYQWTDGVKNLGITNSISGLKKHDYYLEVKDANLCLKKDTTQISEPLQTLVSICAVTIDSVSGKNLVIWEKTGIQRAKTYKVYRETAASGIYTLVDSCAASAFSTIRDTTANPLQQSYKYKMSVVDSCDNESPMSDYHKTIHLNSNQGVNGEVNLIWNVYEGAVYGTHYIMRDVNYTGYVQIGQVSSTATSFTDLNPPAAYKRYRVDIDLATACNPSAKVTSYQRISSNTVNQGTSGISGVNGENDTRIIPNPTTGSVKVVGTQPSAITVSDALGKVVLQEQHTSELSLSALPAGIYIIRLYDEDNVLFYHQKLVKQ